MTPPNLESRVMKVVPQVPKRLYSFRRSWQLAIPYTGSTGWSAAGFDLEFNFALSVSNVNIGGVAFYGPNTPNYSEFVNLFDQYRIRRVILRVDWDFNAYSPANTTLTAPLIYHMADYDESTSVVLTDILQYPKVNVHSFMQNGYSPLIVEVIPRPLTDIASTGVLTAYGPTIQSPWIRTSEATTPHYGIKMVASNFGIATASVIGTANFTCYIDFDCCNPK